MKTKNFFKISLVLFLALFLFSCEKDSFDCSKDDDKEDDIKFGSVLEDDIGFKLQDSNGNDLLSEKTANYLTYDDIDVVYFEKGKEKIYNKPLSDYPKGYTIVHVGEDNYISLELSLELDKNNESLTYLRINNGELDTIKTLFVHFFPTKPYYFMDSSTRLDKVWYNGTLIYDLANYTSDWIVIVK